MTKFENIKNLSTMSIILIILGFPLWFPLLLTAAVLLFTIYLLLWLIIPIYYVVDLVVAVCTLGGLGGFVMFIIADRFLYALFILGCGFVCAGLAIALFVLGKNVVKGIVKLTKFTGLLLKRFVVGKGE